MQDVALGTNKLCEVETLSPILSEMRKTVRSNSSGLLLEMAMDAIASPGKMLRSKMILNLGRIYAIPEAQLVGWASTIELLHNATLVHDDLQDGDRVRRGRQATWAKYGNSQAINLGDFFMLIALQPVLKADIPAHLKCELTYLFSTASARIVNGQSFEPYLNNLESTNRILESYFYCISQKTSALFSLLSEGVAILANLAPWEKTAMCDLFLRLGNIFQMQDDLLDLYGDKQRGTGGCDIREGKVSVLVAHHLDQYPNDIEILREILKKEREVTSAEEVDTISRLFIQKGTVQRVLDHIDDMIGEVNQRLLSVNNEALTVLTQALIREILNPIIHVRSKAVA